MAVDEQSAPAASSAPVSRTSATGSRKWLAFGTGLGIEADGANLRVCAARVRPGGIEVLGYRVIRDVLERPASEWGTDLASFARGCGVHGAPVWLLLPRREVIVRHLMLPGVGEKDLAAAVGYQADALHPYAEDEAVFAHARLGSSPAVLVGVARRETVDRYSNLLTEAGCKIAGISFSAAALYSASRILVSPPETVVALREETGGYEAYGESSARPVYSAVFDMSGERALRAAVSELRAPGDSMPVRFADVLPPFSAPIEFPREEGALALAAAIASACPRLALSANLLPEAMRAQTSRLVWVPTIVLASMLAVAAVVLAWQESYQRKLYVAKLGQEIRTLEKQAGRARVLDEATQNARDRIALIDRYRQRTQADLDAMKEITSIVAPPSWLRALQISRVEAQLNGEGDGASALLKVLDDSPRFVNSSMGQGMARIVGEGKAMENFTIRSQREGPGSGLEAGETR